MNLNGFDSISLNSCAILLYLINLLFFHINFTSTIPTLIATFIAQTCFSYSFFMLIYISFIIINFFSSTLQIILTCRAWSCSLNHLFIFSIVSFTLKLFFRWNVSSMLLQVFTEVPCSFISWALINLLAFYFNLLVRYIFALVITS
jgi:hypothetical protein